MEERLERAYRKFIQELDADVVPTTVTQDLNYAYQLQHKRLNKLGYKIDYQLTEDGLGTHDFSNSWSDDKFKYGNIITYYNMTRTLSQAGRQVYSKADRYMLYATEMDYKDINIIDDEPYTCPNCGADTTIGRIVTGCPSCGAQFKADEIYPRICNYYLTKAIAMNKEDVDKQIKGGFMKIFKWFIIVAIPFILVPALAFIILFMGAVYSYFITSGVFAFKQFKRIGSGLYNAKTAIKAPEARRIYQEKMQQYSEVYSYDYLCNKINTMVRNLLFTDSAADLPYYNGEDITGRFDEILDTTSQGYVLIDSMNVTPDNHCHMKVNCYFDSVVKRGKAVYELQNDTYTLDIEKDLSIPVNHRFSITSLHCDGCGASYNATKQRSCPYCGRDAKTDYSDWIINRIVRQVKS